MYWYLKRFHSNKTINTVFLKFHLSSLKIQKITEMILIKSSFFSGEKTRIKNVTKTLIHRIEPPAHFC